MWQDYVRWTGVPKRLELSWKPPRNKGQKRPFFFRRWMVGFHNLLNVRSFGIFWGKTTLVLGDIWEGLGTFDSGGLLTNPPCSLCSLRTAGREKNSAISKWRATWKKGNVSIIFSVGFSSNQELLGSNARIFPQNNVFFCDIPKPCNSG